IGSVNPMVPQGILINSPDCRALLDWMDESDKTRTDQNNTVATSIDRNITVSAYVCWRIDDGEAVDAFIRRVGTPDVARRILADQIKAELAATIGQKRLDDFISTDATKVDRSMEDIHEQLLKSMAARGEQYGVKIVDIRLRRTSHPIEV